MRLNKRGKLAKIFAASDPGAEASDEATVMRHAPKPGHDRRITSGFSIYRRLCRLAPPGAIRSRYRFVLRNSLNSGGFISRRRSPAVQSQRLVSRRQEST